jgi:heterodisulfide reductase subunit A
MACPYEAPSLVEKMIDGQMDRVSEVDINKCMGCGTCVAACPLGAISRPGVGNQEVREQIYFATPDAGASTQGAPRLVTFVCDWCLRADADVRLLESYPGNVRIVHIPCTGRIDPEMALLALRSGIDGVLVCGCQPGECHYQRGTLISACKMGLLGQMLDHMQIGSGRVRFAQIGTQDRGRIRGEVDAMLENLAALREVA